MKNKKALTKIFGILQIFILVAEVVAMSWIMGASFGEGSVGSKALKKIGAGEFGEVLGREVVGEINYTYE